MPLYTYTVELEAPNQPAADRTLDSIAAHLGAGWLTWERKANPIEDREILGGWVSQRPLIHSAS